MTGDILYGLSSQFIKKSVKHLWTFCFEKQPFIQQSRACSLPSSPVSQWTNSAYWTLATAATLDTSLLYGGSWVSQHIWHDQRNSSGMFWPSCTLHLVGSFPWFRILRWTSLGLVDGSKWVEGYRTSLANCVPLCSMDSEMQQCQVRHDKYHFPLGMVLNSYSYNGL